MRYLYLLALLLAALTPSAASGHGHHALPSPCYAPPGPPPAYVIPSASPTGYRLCAPRTPYAYGWFGVSRRAHTHKSVHYGFYNNRVEHVHE